MIILVGIPGSGKTAILNEAKKIIPSVQVVNYGDKMLEVAAFQKIDRDLIRKQPVEVQKKLGIAAAKKIIAETQGITVVDTHALVKTGYGYCPGLPREILDILAPTACALVECDPSIIMQRRARDNAERIRDMESEEEVLRHQDLSRQYLCACCAMTGALFCCINNSSGSPAQNAVPLLNLIESMKK